MDQEPEKTPTPDLRPPDLSPPPASPRPPDLRVPDLTPPPSIPAPSFAPPSIPAPNIAPPSFGPPPKMDIPESAKKKPKVELPDPDEVKVGDLAPFNTRLIAGIIDVVIAGGLNFAVVLILPVMLAKIGLLAGAAYLLTRDSLPFLNGQSIGKKVMKLRAVTAAGEKPLTNDWATGAIRNIPLVIPFVGLVEIVILLLREEKPEKGRRLGDDFAKTKVIVVGDTAAAVAVEEPVVEEEGDTPDVFPK